jgi:DNA invertase Pin-like site-specific DNA recombinase
MVVLRAGLYERVSTEEQAKYGFSIQTQVENLAEYCKNNNIKIVDHYTEEGVSGAKPSFKRPQMARLLDDVQAGKIDIIIFTKLDRWFRNVKEYFKVQEILEKHKVEWKAIHEDYDTTTANGRMAITLFLAIAQNERDKTSERIKVVFENKIKNKECVMSDRSTPFGYIAQKDENGIRRLVKHPDLKDAMQDFWDIATKYENIYKAAKYVAQNYGIMYRTEKWSQIIHNPFYKGEYRDVKDYCEPYVSEENWAKMQNRHIKKTQQNRVYLFTGLIRCEKCGRAFASTPVIKKLADGTRKEYYRYRCNYADTGGCSNKKVTSELKLEKWLITNLDTLLKNEIAKVEIERTKPKPKPKNNISALKEQLRRLEVVYRAGNKSDEEYIAEANELKTLITNAENEQNSAEDSRDLSSLKTILETDFRTIYDTLSREDKRRFWRGIIKQIHLNGREVSHVDFLYPNSVP